LVYVISHWLRPSQPCQSKDIQGGIMIPVQRQIAVWALVPANREVFTNLAAATAALLACATGIDFHNYNTSFFSFVFQYVHEAAPSGIRDCPGQPVVPEHPLDVQAFDSDQTIGKDQTTGDLKVMLAANVLDASMNPLQTMDGLPSVLPAFLFATDGTTVAAKNGKLVLEITRVRLGLAVTGCQEVRQTHVDADGRLATVRDRNVWQLAREDDIPLARFTLERDGLDRVFHRSMQLDADRTDVLNAKTVSDEPDAITVSWESETVEAVPALEARVAWLLADLDATEEVLKRPLQPSHRGLSGRKIQASEVGIDEPFRLEPRGLFGVLHRSLFGFVSRLPLFETLVVEPPMRFEHDTKVALLVGVGPQSVLESSPHLLALLVFDVLPDGCLADVSDCPRVVRPRPQARQASSECLELFPQLLGRVALQAVDDLGNGTGWIGFHEQVNVVRHNLQGVNIDVQFHGFFDQQVPDTFGNFIDKNRTAILRTPNQVILQREDGTGIFPVSRFHTGIIP
jgi:hypothetical protein